MEPSAYIKKKSYKNNLTLKELSEKSKISYRTLTNLTCNKTKKLSPRIASQIGPVINRKDYEMIYELLFDDAYKHLLTELELLYVSKLYCSGYSIDLNYPFLSKVTGDTKYYPVAKETKSGSKFTVVEDWKKLEEDYLHTILNTDFCSSFQLEQLFNNHESYYNSVLYYGISKVQSISKDPVINYVLLFSDTEDLEIVKPLLPCKSSVKIHLIHETISDELRFVNLLREELDN